MFQLIVALAAFAFSTGAHADPISIGIATAGSIAAGTFTVSGFASTLILSGLSFSCRVLLPSRRTRHDGR